MDITDEPSIDIEQVDIDDDDEVLALLWEEWKVSLRRGRGWTSAAQWATSDSVHRRDPLHPRRITHLILHGYRLMGPVPSSIDQLSSLQELDLSGNQLTSLPPEIGHLSSLQYLYLSNNQLKSLPREISQLSSLRVLNLNNNQLTSLPPEVGHLSSLRLLYLNDNQLTSLPPEISHLSSLQELWLGNNQLTSLPPEIGQLSSLRSLILDDNQLTSPPPEIGQLSSLQWLYLDHNCLIHIPPLPLNATIRGGSEEDQRLPATLEATTWERKIVVDDGGDINTNDTDTDTDTDTESSSGFSLNFYDDASSSIAIADRRTLARRWPFFRHLTSAGLSEAREGSADLSPYFSARLGQCLVDYFEERPVHVSLLQPQDCRDLVEHADYFGLSDALLFHFCIAKLKRDGTVQRPISIHG
ncbi:MAG: leucine-rich repeat domain-containing protein [Candidatus Paceibacterota bacterium]|jgi:hypothetical protein